MAKEKISKGKRLPILIHKKGYKNSRATGEKDSKDYTQMENFRPCIPFLLDLA